MSALSLLQACQDSEQKPYKGFSQLPIGNHEIVKFRFVANEMYNKKKENSLKRVILIELADEVLFLPEYFAVGLNDDSSKIDELNKDGIKKFLCFGGKRANK